MAASIDIFYKKVCKITLFVICNVFCFEFRGHKCIIVVFQDDVTAPEAQFLAQFVHVDGAVFRKILIGSIRNYHTIWKSTPSPLIGGERNVILKPI